MAHNPNGGHYYYQHPSQPYEPQYPDGDGASHPQQGHYAANVPPRVSNPPFPIAPGLPERTRSVAARQNDELLMSLGNPPVSPVRHSSVAAYPSPASQPEYNPRDYAPAPPAPPAHGNHYYSHSIRPSRGAPSVAPQPYNPADYADPSVRHQPSVAYPAGAYGASSSYAAPSPPTHQYSFPRTQSTHSRHSPLSYAPQPATTGADRSAYTPPAPPPLPTLSSAPEEPAALGSRFSPRPPSQPYPRHYSDPYYPQAEPSPPPLTQPFRHQSESQVDRFTPSPYASTGQSSPQRQESLRHPQLRPLPGPPVESEPGYSPSANGYSYEDDGGAQDRLFDEVEQAINMHTGTQSPRIELTESHSPGSYSPRQMPAPSSINGQDLARPVYSDDSEAEAAGGLEAMRLADEQDQRDEYRRQSGQSAYGGQPLPPVPEPLHHQQFQESSDSDGVGIDLMSYGGAFQPSLSYGGDPGQLAARQSSMRTVDSRSGGLSSSNSQRRSEASDAGATLYENEVYGGPYARVDAFGTGGLSEPTAQRRRLSYDEGDESNFFKDGGLAPGDPPDLFYHPGMSNRRPLPPPPPGEHLPDGTAPYPVDWNQGGNLAFPSGPEAYASTVPSPTSAGATLHPGRATSLISHSQTAQPPAPIRSKTDAEYRSQRQPSGKPGYGDSSGNTTASASAVALDLPALPAGRRFNPSKLSTADFRRCPEPWALSSLIAWLKAMTEGENELKEGAIIDGLVALFTHKVPTMNIADAETLSTTVVRNMFDAAVLEREEEWLKFSGETMTGVIFQLSGAGCYAPKLHETNVPGRCYSHHCQRTLKKIDLHKQPVLKPTDDWATYYKIKKEDIESVSSKEVERQNILHEIVQKEEGFMDQLDVLRILYRDALLTTNPPLIDPKRLKKFLAAVFGKVDAVKKANEEFLLPQMKYRQQEQGPWVVGFSDIFREWIRKAKVAYTEYASRFPEATFLVRQEMERNMHFRAFLDRVRADPRSNKLAWDTYLKAPITRLQHYGLLLDTVLKRTVQDSDEKRNLIVAIEEIKAVTHECDAKVAEMSRKVDLTDLQSKLKLRQGMQGVELNLDHLGRELIYKGDLQRLGTTKFSLLETHALLFDHFLVLAKSVTEREGDAKSEKYDVSRLPIPMDLLILESRDDDPAVKSSVRGIAAAGPRGGPTVDSRSGRPSLNHNPAPGNISHSSTSTSIASSVSTASSKTTIASPVVLDVKDDKILYPFRIKHLGKDTYTLFAPSLQNRDEWCDRIVEAKTRHAAALFAQNAEPFKLRVIADAAFAYDSSVSGQKTIVIKGTPLDRAVREVERMFASTGRPAPICRARVNCATSFTQAKKPMLAVGTDIGVFVSEMSNPRGWMKAITAVKVTQIAVLEEFGLFLLISDKSLIAYHLDVVCPMNGVSSGDSTRKAPMKLSGSRDVGFFATGRMKDRVLVFYKKREGLSSTFKVLEPIYQKATEKKLRGFMRSGRTEFFREFDEFYIPTECMGISLYNTSLAVSTLRGFEILTLDKKQPWSVPDLRQPHVATIAQRLASQTPLGMFRLSEQEFLLCYEECAVYVNKHGDVSRSVIMEFVGKARSAALHGPYILLFDQDFVEIRNAQDGRLRQVISGRDIKCLDDGRSGSNQGARTIKVSMQHPEEHRSQIVVELIVNEGLKE